MPRRLLVRLRGRVDRELEAARYRVQARAARARYRSGHAGVALTFDDGPMPGTTDRVLDVLAELGVHASFFCVGRNAERAPALLRRIAAEGHAVGSHSLTHPNPWELTTQQVRAEYAAGRAAVEQALGAPAPLFRPPHGRLSLRTASILRRHRPVLWSNDPQDWRAGTGREQIERIVGAAVDGDVVLLHDWIEQPEAPQCLDRSPTIEALPAVVAAVRSRGLSFVRLAP